MRRCKNCGFSNPDTNSQCEKCGSSLGVPKDRSSSILEKPSTATRNYGGVDLKRTVADSEAFREILNSAESDNGMHTVRQSKQECPRCGYKLMAGETECPNCGETMGNVKPEVQQRPEPVSRHQQEIKPQNPAQPQQPAAKKQSPIGGTVTPWTDMYPTIGNCKLTPIGYEGEKNVPEAITLSGNEHILKRDNTDPSNKTITSKKQAVLVKKDGAFYIQDKSEMGTTFVLAKNEIALKDGDVIMLGNRRFVFNEE